MQVPTLSPQAVLKLKNFYREIDISKGNCDRKKQYHMEFVFLERIRINKQLFKEYFLKPISSTVILNRIYIPWQDLTLVTVSEIVTAPYFCHPTLPKTVMQPRSQVLHLLLMMRRIYREIILTILHLILVISAISMKFLLSQVLWKDLFILLVLSRKILQWNYFAIMLSPHSWKALLVV